MSPITRAQKKKKNQNQELSSSSSSSLILSLPEDLLMHCIAFVPKQNYRNLSRVCKLFRSIVTSTDLFAKRSLLKCTESCMYVPIRDCNKENSVRWYTLIRDNGDNNNNKLVPVTSLPRMPVSGGYAAFGSKIFVIGGFKDKELRSDVSIIDCRFDVAKSSSDTIPEPVCYPVVSDVVDGKIYVIGGHHYSENKPRKSMLRLDTETETWGYDTISGLQDNRRVVTSVTMEGKIYVNGVLKSFVFDPKEGKWEEDELLDSIWRDGNGCVIDEILYTYDIVCDCLKAYDLKRKLYCGVVKGVEGLAKYSCRAVRCNKTKKKKMILLLECGNIAPEDRKIWCAEIALMEMNENGEIWGNVEWCQLVLEGEAYVSDCLTVTV